eukprot:scaffold9435_cov137-Cylindrotheca_fusiformis.AAC.8
MSMLTDVQDVPAAVAIDGQDHIEVNVGGTIFHCSKVTLCSASSYFHSRLSGNWNEERIFIDQDPDSFKILLNYMRHGFVKASEITDFVLVQAEFLGMTVLVNAVKCAAYKHMHSNEASQELLSSEEDLCFQFDKEYGGILPAIKSGILPKNIQPSIHRRKEFVHLGVSNYDTVMQSRPTRGTSFPCLMTKLLQPPRSANGTERQLPEKFSTLIQALNWMHRNGFVTREDTYRYNFCDVHDATRPTMDPPFHELFDHIWFSRPLDPPEDPLESPIVFDQQQHTSMEAAGTTAKQFAALVSYVGKNSQDPYRKDFAIVGAKVPSTEHRICNDGIQIGSMVAEVSYIEEDPVTFLGREGYTTEEKELGELYESMFRKGSERYYLWDDQKTGRLHVKVFSRKLAGQGGFGEQEDVMSADGSMDDGDE